jgi:hypothetical protein
MKCELRSMALSLGGAFMAASLHAAEPAID